MPDALKRITDTGVRVWCHLSDAEVKRETAVASGFLERFVSGYVRLRHGGGAHGREARAEVPFMLLNTCRHARGSAVCSVGFAIRLNLAPARDS